MAKLIGTSIAHKLVVRLASISVLLVWGGCSGEIVDGLTPGDDAIDAGDPAMAQARAKFDREVLPIVTSQCGSCHAGSSNGWMAGNPDAYTSMLAWPQLVDTSSPTSSFLLSKGTHEGPALNPADKATILGWLQLEMTARSGRGNSPKTDTVDVVTGANTFALDSVGAVGSTLTFTAQKLPQGLYLSRISITAGTGGVHITHPLFVTWQDTTPSPDPVDSFDTVDVDIAAGMTGSVGGGLLMLENVTATAKLNVVFQKVGPAKGGGTPAPSGCKAVAAFTTNARTPLSQSCVSCHGGNNVGASNATDMTKINDTTTAGQTTACGQILGRVDLVNPTASGILVAPDPASGASHPFKFPSAAAFTTFKTSLSTWITAEKAAAP